MYCLARLGVPLTKTNSLTRMAMEGVANARFAAFRLLLQSPRVQVEPVEVGFVDMK